MIEEVSKRINDIIKTQDSKHKKNSNLRSNFEQDYPKLIHKSINSKQEIRNSPNTSPNMIKSNENSTPRKQQKNLTQVKPTQHSARNIDTLSPKSHSYTNIQQLRMKSEQSQGIINLVYNILGQVQQKLIKRVEVLENEFKKVILRLQILEDSYRLREENIINSNTSFRKQSSHMIKNSDQSMHLNQSPIKQSLQYNKYQNSSQFNDAFLNQRSKILISSPQNANQFQKKTSFMELSAQIQILSLGVNEKIAKLQMAQSKSKCSCENLLEDVLKTQDYLIMEMKCIKYFNRNKEGEVKTIRTANKKYRNQHYQQGL